MKQGGNQPALNRQGAVAKGIYARMNQVEAAVLPPPGDRTASYPTIPQLGYTDRAPLLPRHTRGQKRSLFVPGGGRKWERFIHAPRIPPNL